MTGLMVGNGLLLIHGDDLVLFLQSSYDTVNGIKEILLLHHGLVSPGSYKRSLIAHVGNVSAGESRSLLGQEGDVKTFFEFDRAEVYLENGLPFLQVRKLHVYLPVKTACPEQCLVKDIGPVCGCKDDHSAVGAEPVHLGEELVKGVLPLIIGTEIRVTATGTPHGVNLINEDNTGSLLLGLLEQVPYPRGAHSNEHFHKVRP